MIIMCLITGLAGQIKGETIVEFVEGFKQQFIVDFLKSHNCDLLYFLVTYYLHHN